MKVGIVGVVGFEQRIHELVEGVPELADIMEPLLTARRVESAAPRDMPCRDTLAAVVATAHRPE